MIAIAALGIVVAEDVVRLLFGIAHVSEAAIDRDGLALGRVPGRPDRPLPDRGAGPRVLRAPGHADARCGGPGGGGRQHRGREPARRAAGARRPRGWPSRSRPGSRPCVLVGPARRAACRAMAARHPRVVGVVVVKALVVARPAALVAYGIEGGAASAPGARTRASPAAGASASVAVGRRRAGDPRRGARVADRGAAALSSGSWWTSLAGGGAHDGAPTPRRSPRAWIPIRPRGTPSWRRTPDGSYLQLAAWARVKAVNGWTSRRGSTTRRPGSAPRSCSAGPGRCPGPSPTRRAAPSLERWDAAPWSGFTALPARAPGRAVSGRATCASTRRSSAAAGPDVDGAVTAALRRRRLAPAPAIQPVRTRVIDLARRRGRAVGRPAQEVAPVRQQGADRAACGSSTRDRSASTSSTRSTARPRTGRVPDPRRSRPTATSGTPMRPAAGPGSCSRSCRTASRWRRCSWCRAGTRVVEPYGGMTAAGADSRANYLLKWEAIRTSREAGATSYDLWGLAHAGIDHFKTGFGGREIRYIGAWDLVLDAFGRRTYAVAAAGPGAGRAIAPRPARAGRHDGGGVRGRRRGRRVTVPVRELGPGELDDWDAGAVDAPGGHVFQSRAWAEHRAASGWRPRFLAAGDGSGAGARAARGRGSRAGRAYLPRGPVGPGTPWARTAIRRRGDRRRAGRRRLGSSARIGVDVLAADPEVAGRRRGVPRAARGRRASTRSRRSSRRATGCACPAGRRWTTTAVMDGIAKATRQRIRRAERDGVVVLRWDAAPGRGGGPGPAPPRTARPPWTGSTSCCARRRPARVRVRGPRGVHRLVAAGARGRPPRLPRGARGCAATATCWAAWSCTATGAPLDGPLRRTAPSGGATTRARCTCCAGGRSSWRSREGRAEMDLGGVDVAGARRPPEPGEPTYGLYEHKRSFGAEWVALAGAQERVGRPLALRGGPGARRRAGPRVGRGGGTAVSAGPRRHRAARRRGRPAPSRGRSADLVARLGAAGHRHGRVGCDGCAASSDALGDGHGRPA